MNHIQQPPLSFSDSQSPVDDSNFQIDKNEQNKKYDLSFSDPSMTVKDLKHFIIKQQNICENMRNKFRVIINGKEASDEDKISDIKNFSSLFLNFLESVFEFIMAYLRDYFLPGRQQEAAGQY
jgi:hypothetical protein